MQRLSTHRVERRAALEEEDRGRDQTAPADLGDQRVERGALLGRRLGRARELDGEGVAEDGGDAADKRRVWAGARTRIP